MRPEGPTPVAGVGMVVAVSVPAPDDAKTKVNSDKTAKACFFNDIVVGLAIH